jgi:hypothetical protein
MQLNLWLERTGIDSLDHMEYARWRGRIHDMRLSIKYATESEVWGQTFSVSKKITQ